MGMQFYDRLGKAQRARHSIITIVVGLVSLCPTYPLFNGKLYLARKGGVFDRVFAGIFYRIHKFVRHMH
jgi:hypothetical protein